jgi:hypothetical protein
MTHTPEIFKKLFNYWPLFTILAGVIGTFFNILICPIIVIGVYFTFKGTKDLIQGVGPLYWITRSDPRYFGVGTGTMHELNAPWRKGRGIYIAICKRSFQLGLCRTQMFSETEGTLSAIQGRYMDTPPSEIGNW